jgi:hypothetical protein
VPQFQRFRGAENHLSNRLLLEKAGSAGRWPRGPVAQVLRRGRRTSSPPQFGQTPFSALVHSPQNVHS